LQRISKEKLKQIIRDKGIYIAMIITVIGLIGIPVLFWFASVIVIGIGTLFFMFFVSGMLGLIQWKYVKEHINMAYHQFAMYAFVGFGICLVNFILLLNYGIKINSHSETYTISREGYNDGILLEGSNEYSALERNFTTYIGEHPDADSFQAEKVTITFNTGLFGFDMISDCKFN